VATPWHGRTEKGSNEAGDAGVMTTRIRPSSVFSHAREPKSIESGR
jgi:hypothetical protein